MSEGIYGNSTKSKSLTWTFQIFFFGLEYGNMPCAHLLQLPDNADHPLHPAPHHPYFPPPCLRHPQLLCLCYSVAATHHRCCHYTYHHCSWTEFSRLFSSLLYALLHLKSTK